ncbi:hypothetical protein [Nocardioides dilutus]
MEATDASLGSGDATARAQELRASLGARQEAEGLLAEAGRIRQDAASAADAMVAEAQQLSEQLVAESRQMAEHITGDARERADDVLARARTEAEAITERARATADAIRSAAETEIEEHRRRVRAEVTEQVTRDLTEQHRLAEERAQERSEALISDLEASVRILGVSLESALANVSTLQGSLEVLRSAADPQADDLIAENVPRHLEQAASSIADQAPGATPYGLEHGPATGVPSATSPFGTEVEAADAAAYDVDSNDATARDAEAQDAEAQDAEAQDAEAQDAEAQDADGSGLDPDRPRSATEAFLTSSSLEIEQSSRELRDLQHPEDARRRRGDESRRAAQLRELEAAASEDEPEPDPSASRPLGWLFRTAQ